MASRPIRKTAPWLVAVASLCVLALAGCDEHITTNRNPEVPISKHATWAWQPMRTQANARDSRRVLSRDVISRGENETVSRDPGANNEIVRGQIRVAIQQALMSKGFKQVGDAEDADFLVDYHLAVRSHRATVEHVYPGGYPGLECGPFGCWEGWGWGPPGISYENVRFREGTIVFDFIQQSSNRLAYRAVGQKPVHRETFSQDEVNDLIRHLLNNLKPGK